MATNEQLFNVKNDTDSVQLPLKIKFQIPKHVKNENDPADNDVPAAAWTVAHDPLTSQKYPDTTEPQNRKVCAV